MALELKQMAFNVVTIECWYSVYVEGQSNNDPVAIFKYDDMAYKFARENFGDRGIVTKGGRICSDSMTPKDSEKAQEATKTSETVDR